MRVLVLLLLLTGFLSAEERPAADLIVTNAKVYTVDKARPHAEAVAVIGARIVAVGTSAEIDAWRGPNTSSVNSSATARITPKGRATA